MDVSESPARADYLRLVDIVSASYGLDPNAIRNRDRTKRIAFGRRIISICLREMRYSYPEIGEAMGLNHTSAMRLYKGASHDPRGLRATKDAERLEAAKVEAAKVLVAANADSRIPREILRRNDALCADRRDTDKAFWPEAVAAYWQSFPHERDALWLELCQRIFPNSWWANASMPPRNPDEAPRL